MAKKATPRFKKLRGIPRRLQALRKWSDSFRGNFPSQAELSSGSKYWNWKLPAAEALVSGRQSSPEIKRQIAQLLIEACGLLIANKPSWAQELRVTCTICVSDMLNSEVCLYLSEDYFRSNILFEGTSSQGVICSRIHGRNLSAEWQLLLPDGVSETGRHIEFPGYENGVDAYAGEYWHFGELHQSL